MIKRTVIFLGLWKELEYIVLRGGAMEYFFSNGYNEKKLKVLYSGTKNKIPNAIITTSFKKHFHEVLNERWHNEEFPTLFYFLPSITDWKKKINQHRDNVNLNLIDCSLDYLNSFSPDKKVSFQPDISNSADAAKKTSGRITLPTFQAGDWNK